MRRFQPSLLTVLAIVFALVAPEARASRLPDAVRADEPGLQRVGGGQLRWLGGPIYEASLWTPAGRFGGYVAGEPVVLTLWYQRAFTRQQLLRIVGLAWQRLDSHDERTRDLWISELGKVWSGVEPGHNLTAVVIPGRETRFYDHERWLGRISDPQFGPAFLDIWLDQSSVVSDLRVQLLGQTRDATGP